MSDYSADSLIQKVMDGAHPADMVEACLVGDYEDGGFSGLLIGFMQSHGVRMFRNERFQPKRGHSTFITECVNGQRRHYKVRVESVDGLPSKVRVECITTGYKRVVEGDAAEIFKLIRQTVLPAIQVEYADLSGES